MNIMTAREFALSWHAHQKYGTEPYAVHLDEVAAIAKPYGVEAVKVAYLHDTLEDTQLSEAELTEQFGARITALVKLLTDESGKNRKERKSKTHLKLKAVLTELNTALIVKVADRLANVRRGGKNDMYREEQDAFRKAAYRPGLCDELWEEIERLLKPGSSPSYSTPSQPAP